MVQRTIETRFWSVSQNNSRGVFDHDAEKGIGYALCVEAIDADDAKARLERIVSSYSQGPYCPCCGERWSIWFFDDEGSTAPELYGRPIAGGWGLPSYIHYFDGKIEECAEASAS